MTTKGNLYDAEPNRDLFTSEPGAHPIGTGLGAALGGATAGALTGTTAGPVGTLIGAALGAIVGGLAGKSVAETIDPTCEDIYWRENFNRRPYYRDGSSFDDYAPAYHYGVVAYGKYRGRSFDDIEAELSQQWVTARGRSSLEWLHARDATRDAWDRLRAPA